MPLERRVPASEEFANCGPKLALASIFVIHTWHMCALIDPHLAHVCTDCNFPSGSKTALWRGGTGDLTYRVGRMTTASIGRRGGGMPSPSMGLYLQSTMQQIELLASRKWASGNLVATPYP